MQPLILALDIGTSSSRSALFESDGARIIESTAQQAYPIISKTDGTAELEPLRILQAIKDCLSKTLHYARSHPNLKDRKISAIGTSCFWHSLIAVDSNAVPLTNVITWADSRCREDASTLRQEFSEKEIHRRTGCMLRTSFWPAQLRRIRRTNPSLFHSVHQWLSPAEWLQRKLTGTSHCAIGMVTGTGLLNPSTLELDHELLTACSLERSDLGTICEDPVEVSGELSREFPELIAVPWFPAIGDGAASNLGSGCTTPAFAAINVGTSAALRIMQSGSRAEAPFGLFCYRVDKGRYLIGGAVSNAGNLRAWALRELQIPDSETLESLLASRPTPDHGLTVLPFWSAERAPTWNESLAGNIFGITQATTGVDLLQAITEATYHRIALISELVISQTNITPKFLVSGGIQHSQSSLQRLADILNRPVYKNPEQEASLRGAAIFALERLHLRAIPLPQTEALNPRENVASQYQQARQKQTALEEILKSHSK